ncbi:MAG: ATP-binding protein [Gemmatimonadaceae bacterium]
MPPRDGAILFFQLRSRRYDHASTVLTSNKGFEEWSEIGLGPQN